MQKQLSLPRRASCRRQRCSSCARSSSGPRPNSTACRLAAIGWLMQASATLSRCPFLPAAAQERRRYCRQHIHVPRETGSMLSLTSGGGRSGVSKGSHQPSKETYLSQAHQSSAGRFQAQYSGTSTVEASWPCRGVCIDCCTAAYCAGTASQDIHSA